jgi:hypothetical protein
MNNLVLGAAFGYTVDKMKPFVLSLRRYYSGIIVFVVDKVTDETEKFFEDNEIYTYIPDEPLTKEFGNVTRFKHYLDCIEENFENIDNIFLADIRDIVFQSDPFADYPKHNIEFFAEPELFKNCIEHNAPWYAGLYGMEKLKEIETEYVLCAGTTMGNRETILKYIKELLGEVNRLASIGRAHGTCDQAVHNHLAYTGVFDDQRINHNGTGLVSTMHHSKVLSFNRQGQLLNNDGTPTPVIHQYDRCGPMSTVFLKNALGLKGRQGIRVSADYAISNFFEHDLG